MSSNPKMAQIQVPPYLRQGWVGTFTTLIGVCGGATVVTHILAEEALEVDDYLPFVALVVLIVALHQLVKLFLKKLKKKASYILNKVGRGVFCAATQQKKHHLPRLLKRYKASC